MLKYLVAPFALLLVSGCQTTADPEPYMGFDCQQLRAFSANDAPVDLAMAPHAGPDPQSGLKGDRAGLQTEQDVSASQKNDEARAVRAAYKAKNCQ